MSSLHYWQIRHKDEMTVSQTNREYLYVYDYPRLPYPGRADLDTMEGYARYHSDSVNFYIKLRKKNE
jgi:hypothetical protein